MTSLNRLLNGVYAITRGSSISPTLIRLPGYPAFLAAVFAIFGVEHYHAAAFVQIAFDVATCVVLADLARRTVSQSASGIAFVLCATCPFLANYAGMVLTETLSIFFATLALDLAVIALEAEHGPLKRNLHIWAGCGAAIGAGILLRPDGGILLMAVSGYLAVRFMRHPQLRRQTIAAGLVLLSVSLAPLVPWTWRNWRTFQVLQPLAPQQANDPGEFVPRGFIRWQRTWLVDYESKIDITFRVDGDTVNPADLPRRALDSAEERRLTEQYFAAYNAELSITPELDDQFAALASQRIHRAPFRYYVWLPTLRALDLWFRARTEDLPVDPHFWDAMDDPPEAVVTLGLIALNLCYVAVALAGFISGRVRYAGLMVGFCVVRTLVIAVLELPESRYVLECYPLVLLLAAAALTRPFPMCLPTFRRAAEH